MCGCGGARRLSGRDTVRGHAASSMGTPEGRCAGDEAAWRVLAPALAPPG